MRELLFGARLTLAGGRTGIVRTLITALGVGLGVAALLLAASLPTISAERADRRHARDAVLTERQGPTTVLVGTLETDFRGEAVQGRLLQAEGDRPVVPPGLSRFPAPGELFVTPALPRCWRRRTAGACSRPGCPDASSGRSPPTGCSARRTSASTRAWTT